MSSSAPREFAAAPTRSERAEVAASAAKARQVARLRAMSASEKVAVMNALYREAWALKRAGVRAQHVDWTEEQVEARVRELFLANRR